MKKRICTTLFTMALLLTTFSLLPKQSAQAKTASKAKTVHVDLNEDGQKETLFFKPIVSKDGSTEDFKKLSIYINGKRMSTFTEYFFSYEYRFITLENGKKFLYLHPQGLNGDGFHRLYQYKKGKLKRVINFDTNPLGRWIGTIKANGNELRVNTSDNGSGIGLFHFNIYYTYKNGAFHLKSKTHKVTNYYLLNSDNQNQKSGVCELTVSKEFTIYSDKTAKTQIGTVPVGTKVKLTK
ncbi:MAG: hypothetical protein E7277_03650, partial [Lachnospiraceae bacterium]|nr:hypothetical protein [Lachnospiraceae bacterium]